MQFSAGTSRAPLSRLNEMYLSPDGGASDDESESERIEDDDGQLVNRLSAHVTFFL